MDGIHPSLWAAWNGPVFLGFRKHQHPLALEGDPELRGLRPLPTTYSPLSCVVIEKTVRLVSESF
jgi:hypothetical protein